MMTAHRSSLITLVLAIGITGAAGASNTTTKKWSWLANTYWYVPTKNLPAYSYSPVTNTLAPVSDQTLFYIAGYADGYFWGNLVAQIASNSPSCQSIVGSVTPEGSVYLSLNILPYSPGNSPTTGLGRMVKKGGQWTMENQMSTGLGPLQIGHWAYMVQTKPRQPSWNLLPGVNVSVEQFLALCPNNTPVVTDK